ncbi:adenylate/guanylate cyclase domain-containing protein [Candidatus Deferrimicrobium sp.]|uniref:CHASE2 domain-containing protein n=1 Tax=Candidatus Deferrimicrobium sp. TaxID=3060586 RepID=UPI002ED98ADB
MEENIGLGLLFKLRGALQAPRDAVVISIDRESSEQLNIPDNPDKWPRSLHARLTETLAREGAKVVSFDLHFIEPRVPKDDAVFAEAMKKARNVVLTEPIRTKDMPLPDGDGSSESSSHNIVKVVPPIELFSNVAVATAPFTLPRIPFKVARFFTFEPGAGDSPSVPMVTLQLYCANAYGDFIRLLQKASPDQAGKYPHDLSAAIASGSLRDLMRKIRGNFQGDPAIGERMRKELESSKEIAGDPARSRLVRALIRLYEGSNNRFIDYYGPPRTITTIPYHEALQIGDGAVGERKIDLKDKAVFVGLSEAVLAERKDSFYTVFSRANGIFIGGVEISATAFSNILEDTPVRPVGLLPYALIVVLWGVAMGVICRYFHVGIAAMGVVGLSCLYLAVAWYRFKTGNTWVPLVVPLFFQAPLAFVGAVVWNYLDAKREQEKVRKAFEHYLPKNVVDQLVENLGEIGAVSETVYGVCLFTDAEHYTTLSETLDPKELGAFMNRYYETMFRQVKENGGVVSNLAGDSMLAIWVSATPDAALRDKACLAAIDINQAVHRLYGPTDPHRLNTRIGLHYGDIFLGNIGGGDHYQHSVMGDIVNTASRIEGLNKHLGTRVLVSDEVIDRLGGLLSRELGGFRLKGKTVAIRVHELICRLVEADEKQKAGCAMFAAALAAFRKKSWEEAAEKFRGCMESLPGDEPSTFYVRLCEQHKNHPPAETWDGVVNMDAK